MKTAFILLTLLALAWLAGCSSAPAAIATLPPAATAPSATLATPLPAETATASTLPPKAPPATTDAGSQEAGPWKILRRMPVNFSVNVAGFLDESFGISVGDGGTVHYTLEGGQNWPEAQNNTRCRYDLDVVNPQIAWHCGNDGTIGLSEDGGQTWQVAGTFGSQVPNQCLHVSFLDDKTGWASTASRLGFTQDDAKSFTEIQLPAELQKDIKAIRLRTEKEGYLMDSSGVLWSTADAGQTWTAHTLGLKDGESFLSIAPNAAIRFMDAEHGILGVVLMVKGEKVVTILRTEDGGQTWQRELIHGLGSPALYLSADGRLLSATNGDEQITLLRYQQP